MIVMRFDVEFFGGGLVGLVVGIIIGVLIS